MDTDDDTLQIELEDIGGTSWWAGVLTVLASQSGGAHLRFVGTVGGQRRYTGPSFTSPRTVGTLPPQPAWAPEMTAGLRDLTEEIEKDGWAQVGVGDQPWAMRYRRPAPADAL